MTRINRVLEHMAKLQVDSVIIKDVTTIRYLTGFTGDSSLLYLDRQQGVLITDGRYTEQARNEMKFFKVLEYTPTGAHSIWAAAADLAKNAQAQVVGFDGAYYSYDDYTVLHELLGETYMQSIDFSDIRMIKDKKELDMLLKAASIADEAFIHLLEDIKPQSGRPSGILYACLGKRKGFLRYDCSLRRTQCFAAWHGIRQGYRGR